MKQSLLIITFLLILFIASFGQENPNCPMIKVIEPEELIRPGDSINFSTAIMGKFENKRLEYTWTISSGAISAGQGSPAITVATTEKMEGQTVTATVAVKGVPESCKNSASGTGEIDRFPPPPIGDPLDEYGKVSWPDVRNRIQNSLLVELANDPTSKGLFEFYIANDSERKSVLIMQKKILNFLKQSKIPSSRIIMSIQKGYEYRTVVWIVPKGAKLPGS